jgi:hypothetical protein
MLRKIFILVGCFLILFRIYIKSESKIRLLKCMLLNFYCLVKLLINRNVRGKLVK